MTLKQLIKLEDKAREVWVISPTLHYDTENKDFSELVSVNLGEKTKYKYIVPATPVVARNLKVYKKLYEVNDEEINKNFLILPESMNLTHLSRNVPSIMRRLIVLLVRLLQRKIAMMLLSLMQKPLLAWPNISKNFGENISGRIPDFILSHYCKKYAHAYIDP